jgi:hypothetical protein
MVVEKVGVAFIPTHTYAMIRGDAEALVFQNAKSKTV